MNIGKNKKTIYIAAAGSLLVLLILVLGTLMMGRGSRRDTEKAVRSVSVLYLDELAGRREKVVENNLKNNIDVINIALEIVGGRDLDNIESFRRYQQEIKQLFNLERFAFIDESGAVYTVDEGVVHDADNYAFDYRTLSAPHISVRTAENGDKKVVIAVPVKDRDLRIGEEKLAVCFMEIDMEVMLQGVSMTSEVEDATFCNIYMADGTPLSNAVIGGVASEINLMDALAHAELESGYSVSGVADDFRNGHRGIVAFSYNGIPMTLSYVPVEGTDWLLTYLIQESVISNRISPVTSSIIRKSLIQSVLTAAVLVFMFSCILYQTRKNARLTLEKETTEAENRAKREEMEQRIALQEQLLAQKDQQEKQEKMITALAADYRSVYYLELDRDYGICYQARTDLQGFRTGEEFSYLSAVTAYCNQYVLESYREDFLRFIQPENIRRLLKDNHIISFRYIISVNGKESYEAVRFTDLHHEDAAEHEVNNVGAGFLDVDEETKNDIAQQQILTDALTATEQASKAKTAFLSNMSHEIRTPMNAIIGLNNIALHEPGVPEPVRGHLVKIGDSAQHLLGIINDILDMSRIESGRMVIKNEEFSFAKDLEQVNTIISGQCADKGLHYECRTSGRIDECYIGDGMKLKQVMINILGNAVKFTPEGGSVTFLIEEGLRYNGKATLKMTFADTGIGMSEDYLPHIFDAFSQEDSSLTSVYGSTGLGMPITKSIVELMNGHIEVESEKGKGTVFTVTVPLGECAKDSCFGLGEDLSPADLNVLVIDDDEVALEHARIVLNQAGISCDLAGSGAEGLEMVKLRHGRRDDYDLLLIDWKMPDMDGVETTRKIRAVVGNDTPIIILTSYNWDEIAEEARKSGVDTFVPKPLFAGNVLDEFREAFNEKRLSAAGPKAELQGRRILLAEDVQVNAEIMVMVLDMKQIQTDIAENGQIAVDKYLEHPAGYYDAVLMDMRMPVMDGLTATRLIRDSGREDAKTIPIVALTANAFDEDVQRSLQAGLNAHLSKPVEPEILFETLETLIRP